ncbi:MAG: hypothetical protein E7387_04865 [Ruminococcaceae bacterium]|nr:hypothetical protein [Oscillospiraceae bacterium]
MKDFVFVGWSKNRELAIKVKNLIDKNGFVGVVGGDYEENPERIRRQRKGTINETINYQMNQCDQAILLFQKTNDNLISGNLIYELGYINAQYNYTGHSTKLHVFKIDITQDVNLFPSDLHGIWGTMLSTNDKTQDDIAREIVTEFLRSQSQIKKKDKIQLLNDHHMVEFEIMKHFENPTMSDYDLAKDILVYLQAAFCYQEQADIKLKLQGFKSKMLEKREGSEELRWATDYAELTVDLFCKTVPVKEHFNIQMDRLSFRKFLDGYECIGARFAKKTAGIFETAELKKLVLTYETNKQNEFGTLLIAQIQEHITYLILVYLSSGTLEEKEKIKYSEEGIFYGVSAQKNLEIISQNSEDEMYAKLLLCYTYKNLSAFYNNVGNTEKSEEYSKASLELRKTLKDHINGIPFIRPSLKEYFTLEYLIQAIDIIKICDDEYVINDYMLEIEQYLEQRKISDSIRNLMVNDLSVKYNKLKKE